MAGVAVAEALVVEALIVEALVVEVADILALVEDATGLVPLSRYRFSLSPAPQYSYGFPGQVK